MHFTKQLIYFLERNFRAGKKQMLYFTVLPWNLPLCRSETLRE
jgi:hypothetical protein